MILLQNLRNRSKRNLGASELSNLTDGQLEDLGVDRSFVRRKQRAYAPMQPNEAWPSK